MLAVASDQEVEQGTTDAVRGYRVSRCSVCWRSQRQYFFISIRSVVFFLFFVVL